MCCQGMEDSPKDERRSAGTSRRSNKPLMEKRRRARINDSLSQLKTLVLQAMKKDSTQYSKLEKADILEMTVKHLKMLQRQQMSAAMTADPYVLAKYTAGYNECASEVSRYLQNIQGLNSEVRDRVMNHLSNCLSQLPLYNQSIPYLPTHLQGLQMQGHPASHLMTGPVPISRYPWPPMCVSAPSMVPSAMTPMPHPAGGFIKMEACRSPAITDPKYFKLGSSFKPPVVKQERPSPDPHSNSPIAHRSPELSESMDSVSDMDSDPDRSRESVVFSPCIDLSTPKTVHSSKWQEFVDSYAQKNHNGTHTSPVRPRPVEATAVRDKDEEEGSEQQSMETMITGGPSNGQLPCGVEAAPPSNGNGLSASNSSGELEGKVKTENCGGPDGVADLKEGEQIARPVDNAPQVGPQEPAEGKMWRPW